MPNITIRVKPAVFAGLFRIHGNPPVDDEGQPTQTDLQHARDIIERLVNKDANRGQRDLDRQGKAPVDFIDRS